MVQNSDEPRKQIQVAIIGAGACGLTVARCVLDEAIEPVIFERAADAGGIWNYHEEHPQGGGIAYRSLRTNTSKQMMAFSDFPFPSTAADFPSREDVLRYLTSYADRFDLRKFIRFKTVVERISDTSDDRWSVCWRSEEGLQKKGSFDAVVVCTGFYHNPVLPRLQGIEHFQGQVLHSRDYKGPEGFDGKRVVVVGAGSSGADIAAEISTIAVNVELSTRAGAWFLPNYIGQHPYDFQLTRFSNKIPYRLRMRVFRSLVYQSYERMGFTNEFIERALHLPEFDIWRARLTPGSQVLKQILSGRVRVRSQISNIKRNAVVFADGTVIPTDTIVLCTGYSLDFPFLDAGVVKVRGDSIDLYKNVFAPRLPTLAFVGMCIVAGPIFPVAEMQARWITQVLAGKTRLPRPDEMVAAIEKHNYERTKNGVHPMRIQLAQYLDDIADLVGIRPKLLHHPRVLRHLVFGPLVAAQYRLDGPGKSADAEAVIASVNHS